MIIIFKTYKNSILATIVSFLGMVLLVMGFGLAIEMVSNSNSSTDDLTAIVALFVFGLLFEFLSKKVAIRKEMKIRNKNRTMRK